MKKVILWVMVLLCMAPAVLQAGWGWGNKPKEEKKVQQAEPKQVKTAPLQAVKEKTPEEKQAAIKQYRENQIAKSKAFQQGIRDKQMAELKAKLALNTKMTDAQKNEIIAAREKQYEQIAAFVDKRRSENNAFFQKLANDPSMTEEQKREAIRAHFQSQKPSSQAFKQQQTTANKTEGEKIRSEVPPAAKTVAS